MARRNFSVTFERWSPDDVEAGETDNRGFVLVDVSLREAINFGLEYARPEWCDNFEPNDSRPGHARWLTFYGWNEGTQDYYQTGIEESRSLHIPDHITPASRRRIVRLFAN